MRCGVVTLSHLALCLRASIICRQTSNSISQGCIYLPGILHTMEHSKV